ncbi:hypothetical protein HOT49_gp317 [Erwinia phage vB_EamM_Alexandra]|uniref:Uncharacterized protein n=1 Tax=Erwinia phage vB_EamM_Alexandra TaxID=2201424 RepID=A0A2Z4QE73_9CAUD|nr:hypothetical protein HOT49_gp317 [Erwinia phage vB_EamM_Alexandra]AWY08572.1 hypothetical protein Alexandra_321 [Erwinia phage vB_EamM_Alexandra]
MSFDLRQNLLLVRDASLTGKPLFYFYTAMGRVMVLTGDVLREILERQKEGTLCTNTYWGFVSDPTLEVWSFDDNNDLMLHHRIGKSCKTFLPYEMIASAHDGFKPINGMFIEDSLHRIIKIHLKATCREEQKITWFADLPEPEMRSMLLSLGLGPLRVEREDKEGLVKLHDQWLEDFDDKYKYTHNTLGLDEDEKIPADYRPERIRDITKRMMAGTKTQEMMDQTLSDLLGQCRIRGDVPMPNSKFNRSQLTCYYATHLIFAHDADEKLRSLIDNPQFLVNFIYGWYPDYTWITINEETFDYQQSLVRAALISLKSHVQNEIGTYKLVHGMVTFTEDFDPHAKDRPEEVEDEEEYDEEEDDDAEQDVIDYLRTRSEDELRAVAIKRKMITSRKAKTLDKEELVEVCADYYGSELPEDFDEAEEKEQERVPTPRKFPALSNASSIKYDIIRSILSTARRYKTQPVRIKKTDRNARKEAEVNERKRVIDTLRDAVNDNWLESLPANTLTALAYSLTKMKDNDRYPRDCAFLKELIKHAVK